ncbi:hypothetical protein BDW62DRAFT_197508 [Aspergillus aurantiobrunneus]
MPLQHPSSTTTTYLDQPPSCLQFCPASPNNVVVGTYLLSETKTIELDGSETIQQSKTGSLQLWHLDPETDTLSQISRYSLNAAVFDLHFHPRNPNILAIATSTASVSLFAISDSAENPGFTHLWTKSVHEDPSIPALFLAWLPDNWLSGPSAPEDAFAVTFSDGRVGVFGLGPTALDGGAGGSTNDAEGDEQATELRVFEAWEPIEIWFVAVASYLGLDGTGEGEAEVVYTPYLFTGNDFGSLHTRRFADVQGRARTRATEGENEGEGEDEDENSNVPPLILNADDKARHHTAGVTAILPLPIPLSHPLASGEPLVLTGSYDENLRVYHATRGGRVLAEAGLGGGVWRLQLLETVTAGSPGGGEWSFVVLASCMHGGTRVVRVTIEGEVEAGIEVLAEFTEHESMNYASDVWRSEAGDGDGSERELRVVSSSFYDRRVCVWGVEL